MSVRRPSVASERSVPVSDRNSVLSPAKTASTAEQPAAEQPTRQYANSITSSQMTHETMDYTNDDRSTHTAQAEQIKANMKPEKLSVHPRIVPTNADLKRSNMLDRYAGVRDPTFKATWDLSEIAKGADTGKAGSIFSFSTTKNNKKKYDVAVKNPIIAAKEAEAASKGGAGSGFGGLFRRGSRASHQEGPPSKPVLIDEKRDPKELFQEAERQAAWEAQEKERKEEERQANMERARISQEMAKQERKRKDAEMKEQRRREREERKRDSKLTVNTANTAPPPRYSHVNAQQTAPSEKSPEALSSSGEETSPSTEPQHSEGHRLGDEVPTGDRPHESNFNEEFSVLDQSAHHEATSDDGSSITEEAPRTAQEGEEQQLVTPGATTAATSAHEVPTEEGRAYRDIGTQTLVDSSAQTDPVKFASSSGTATPTAQPAHQPRFAGPPVALTDKVTYKEPPKPDTSSTPRTTPATGGQSNTAATAATKNGSGSGGIKGLFRRLSRTKSNRQSYKPPQSGASATRGTGPQGVAATTTPKAVDTAKTEQSTAQPEKATVTTQVQPERPDDAQSMLTLDSMWVKPSKKSKTAPPQSFGTVMSGPAMALYHENGIHDTVYPAAAETSSEQDLPSRSYAGSSARGPSSAFALYHQDGHHTTVYPTAGDATPTAAPGSSAPAAHEIQQTQHLPNSFHPPPVPMKSGLRNGLGPVAKEDPEESSYPPTPAALASTDTFSPAGVTTETTEASPAPVAQEAKEVTPVADDAEVAHATDEAQGADAAVADRPDDLQDAKAAETAPIAQEAKEANPVADDAEVAHATDEAQGADSAVADRPDDVQDGSGADTSITTEHPGDVSVDSAFSLYHETGAHSTVYPELK